MDGNGKDGMVFHEKPQSGIFLMGRTRKSKAAIRWEMQWPSARPSNWRVLALANGGRVHFICTFDLLPNAAERGQAAAKRAPIAAGMAEMRRTGRMAVQKVPIRVKFTTINRTHWMDDIIN